MNLQAGARLGAYEIVAPLGAGGMGEVYRAHDARLGRDVAIKVLPASLSSDPVSLARFEREARAIGALNHPNIVNVYDVGTHEGVAYVVMELLEGETLRARMHGTSGPASAPSNTTPKPGTTAGKAHGLPKKKALEIAQQIAQGLAAAHARGIVHRDLKPENLLLTNDGRVKILDFGLARAMPDAVQQMGDAQTQASPNVAASDSVPGMVLGTVGYMAPEQVRGQAVDHRADIFAFGAVLYEMLTGERAFDGESPIETMSAILKADPMEAPAATVSVSGPIEPLLRHCLEKQPDERFQSARDLAFQLQAISSGALSTSSAERAVGKPGARRLVLPLAVAAALLLGVAIGALFVRGPTREDTFNLAVPMPSGVSVSPGVSPARSGGVAVSPDGRRIVFVGRTASVPNQLFVRSLDSADMRPLAGTEGAWVPAWSPDGRRLAFFKDRKLQVMAVDGGSLQAIADMGNPRSAPTWNADDSILYHPDYRQGLMRVPASGGTPVEVLPAAAADTHVSWFSPVWLPDGRRFLVVRFAYSDIGADKAGIYVGSIDAKEPTLLVAGPISEATYGDDELYYRRGLELVAQPFNPGSATLSGQPRVLSNHVSMVGAAARTLVYFDPPGGLSQGHRVTIFSRDGAVLSRVGEIGTFRDPRLSPDGRHLAVARAGETGVFSIWSYDLARNIDSRVSGSTFVSPAWGPDGQSIYAGGPASVFKFDVFGGAAPQLVRALPTYANVSDVTPDGKEALLQSLGAGTVQFNVVALDGKSAPRPIAREEPFAGQTAAVAPDGRWIAMVSQEGTAPRLSVRPFPGPGPRVQVTAAPAFYPRWRRDGRELFYLNNVDGGGGNADASLMSVSVAWTASGPDFGTPQRLFTLPRPVLSNLAYDVTSDGQKFVAILQSDSDPSPLTVRVRVRK